MTDDASRKAILARRAKFVAAALAGIGTLAACRDNPMVCLKISVPHDAEAEDVTPQPCLSPPRIDPDAAPPSSLTNDAGASPTDAGAATDAGPTHGLKPHPHPTSTPKVCLRMVQPKDKDKL